MGIRELTKSLGVVTRLLTLPLCLAIAAWFIAQHIERYNTANMGDSLYYPAASAAFCTSFLIWWWFHVRKDRYEVKRSIASGLLIGFLSHPVMWYFAVIRAHYRFLYVPDCACPPPVTLSQGFQHSVFLSLMSWISYGWLTLLIACVTTLFFSYAYRVTHKTLYR